MKYLGKRLCLRDLSKILGPFDTTQVLWGDTKPQLNGHTLSVLVGGLDATVIKLPGP